MADRQSKSFDTRRRARRNTAALVRLLRDQIEHRGMTLGKLAARTSLSEARIEHVLAHPTQLGAVEAVLICEGLGLSMARMLRLANAATDREEAEQAVH